MWPFSYFNNRKRKAEEESRALRRRLDAQVLTARPKTRSSALDAPVVSDWDTPAPWPGTVRDHDVTKPPAYSSGGMFGDGGFSGDHSSPSHSSSCSSSSYSSDSSSSSSSSDCGSSSDSGSSSSCSSSD